MAALVSGSSCGVRDGNGGARFGAAAVVVCALGVLRGEAEGAAMEMSLGSVWSGEFW